MFNLNTPSSLLGIDGCGLSSTPKTPEIVNTLIAMTNPLDNYSFTSCINNTPTSSTTGSAASIRNVSGTTLAQTSQDSSHSSSSTTPVDSPAGANSTTSVQQITTLCIGTTAPPSMKIPQATPATISTMPIVPNASNTFGSHMKTGTATVAATAPSNSAIYKNNAIRHENGITTIVPTSLVATSQMAVLNEFAPSTVTITPAPAHQLLTGTGTGAGPAGSNNPSSISHTINGGKGSHLHNPRYSPIQSNSSTAILHHHQTHHQHNHNQHLHHHNVTTNLNQKVILLKALGSTKYNNLTASTSINGITGVNANTSVKLGSVRTKINAGVCKN